MEPSLLRFICSRFPHLDETRLLTRAEFDPHNGRFRAFLQETQVVSRISVGTESASLTAEILNLSYPEFIDSLAKLGSGFLGLQGQFSIENSPSTNFTTNLLKSTLWEKLCVAMGRESFVDLLNSAACFLRPEGNITLNASSMVKKKNNKADPAHKFAMYYRKGPSSRSKYSLMRDAEVTLRQMFKIHESVKHLPKKYRQLLYLLTVAKKNDDGLHHQHILRNVVQTHELKKLLFENATSFSEVARFVFILVHRVLPNDVFGCQHNWNLINSCVHEMLKSERTEAVNIQAIVSKLKVTSIPWLGKSARPTSKQDYQSRLHLLHVFVRWFFSNFVTRLVSFFWYVTENSAKTRAPDSNNAFFLHATWNRMSQSWLKQYSQKYLRAEPGAQNLTAEAKYNCGVLRLIPKKTDFRPLCIPVKLGGFENGGDELDRDKRRKRHFYYDYNVMKPIRDILRNQQRQVALENGIPFPRCNSVNDVGRGIAEFRARLVAKHGGEVPPLYGVQFDMKHCYDNLNQGRILQCVKELFGKDPSSEEYIVRKYSVASKKDSKYAPPKNMIKNRSNMEELDVLTHIPTNKKHAIFGDKVKTLKFSQGDVLDLVRSQVLDANIKLPKLNSDVLKRTRGVFQGFPLSGTLCDIVYNSLVDNVLAKVQSDAAECILLRLADDFFFVSTQKQACQAMLECARSRSAKEYGAHINPEKVSRIDSSENGKEHAQFLGLTIDLRTLSIERAEDRNISLSGHIKRSLKAVLAYLEWRFRFRLADLLLDVKVSDFGTVCKNAANIYCPTLKRGIVGALENIHVADALDQLSVFTLQIIRTILDKFQFVNGQSCLSQDLFAHIWQITEDQLRKNGVSPARLQHLLNIE